MTDHRLQHSGVRASVSTAAALAALAVIAAPAAAALSMGRADVTVPASGSLRDWGDNVFGELGDGKNGTVSPYSAVPVTVRLPAGVSVTAVAAGCYHALALTSADRVLAWGYNAYGQLGDGDTTNADVPVYVKLPAGTKVIAISAGCYHSLALTSAGRVLAWGYNGFGELGDGTLVNSDKPVQVKLPAGVRVQAISAGGYHNLALAAGRLYAWGDNSDGQLGDGSTVNRKTPARVKLPAGVRVQAISAGGYHSLAVTTTGHVLAWGYNQTGQVGDGSTTNRDTPVQAAISPGTGKVVAVSAGCNHSLALTSRHVALAWGFGGDGQLGDGGKADRLSPVRVALPAGVAVTSLAAGCLSSFAATAAGRLLAWGENDQGQLGDGSTVNRDKPVTVRLAASLTAVAVAAGCAAEQGLAIVR
jgi:alpha-tubulin suppressor-like RCC1 family protein